MLPSARCAPKRASGSARSLLAGAWRRGRRRGGGCGSAGREGAAGGGLSARQRRRPCAPRCARPRPFARPPRPAPPRPACLTTSHSAPVCSSLRGIHTAGNTQLGGVQLRAGVQGEGRAHWRRRGGGARAAHARLPVLPQAGGPPSSAPQAPAGRAASLGLADDGLVPARATGRVIGGARSFGAGPRAALARPTPAALPARARRARCCRRWAPASARRRRRRPRRAGRRRGCGAGGTAGGGAR